MDDKHSLDRLDREILRLIQQDASLSNQDIADVLNTTPATVATTVQRLRKKTQGKANDITPAPDTGSKE